MATPEPARGANAGLSLGGILRQIFKIGKLEG